MAQHLVSHGSACHRRRSQISQIKLGREIVGLLQDSGRAAELGRAGYDAWQANRGSAQRNIEVIRDYLAHDRER